MEPTKHRYKWTPKSPIYLLANKLWYCNNLVKLAYAVSRVLNPSVSHSPGLCSWGEMLKIPEVAGHSHHHSPVHRRAALTSACGLFLSNVVMSQSAEGFLQVLRHQIFETSGPWKKREESLAFILEEGTQWKARRQSCLFGVLILPLSAQPWKQEDVLVS